MIDKNEELLLSLDISTKTIGIALWTKDGKLLELTHISPVAKPKPVNKTEELLKKVDLTIKFLNDLLKGLNIKSVVIEEPLLRSNNVNTIATLLKFNGMVSRELYKMFNIIPEYLSSYESRKNAWPELMREGSTKGKLVLFGGFDKSIDKKLEIWKLVAKREPEIKWLLDKKGQLSKESFDLSDAYTCGLAFFRMNNIIH